MRAGNEAPKMLLSGILVAATASLVLAILLLRGVPPVGRDALTHHLAVPKLYLKYGGLVEIPRVPFSYYPMNLDLLYMIPLYFGNDIIPKFIHFAFALLTSCPHFRLPEAAHRKISLWVFRGLALSVSADRCRAFFPPRFMWIWA